MHCVPCPAGTYKDTWGSASCTSCPPYSSSDSNAAECACIPGWLVNERKERGRDFLVAQAFCLYVYLFLAFTLILNTAKRGIECQHTTDTHARLHKPVEMNTCRWGYPNYQEQVEAKEHMFCKPCTQGSSALFAWRTSMHLDIISLCFAQVFWITFLFLLYSVCRSDSSLVQAAMGRFYCPGGTRRYPCRLYSASGSDANGNPDATPCKCTFGEESGGPGLSSGCKSPSR